MEKLPNWIMTKGQPAIYDSESATAQEMVAKLYGKMNELIVEYNEFNEEIRKITEDFIKSVKESGETFEVGMMQKFQDFTDVIELHVRKMNQRVVDAEMYMRDNIIEVTKDVLDNMLKGEDITIKELYDEETETVSVVFSTAE